VSRTLLLCVDDEPDGLMVRKLMLEHQGYEVLTAQAGREGLELLRSKPVSGVILDYFMPEMDGAEVAAEMKRMKPEVPILMLSAYFSLPKSALQNVNAFITKGESPGRLLAKIGELISSRRR